VAFLISFFILPIWMLADQVVQWLVKYTMLNLKLYEKSPTSQPNAEGDNDSEQAKGTELFAKVKFYARFVLIIAIGLWVASLWGYTLPFVSKMSGVIFKALLIMVVALLFWQFISSWIERKIKDSVPVPEEGKEKPDEEDDEWGTTVASRGRAYTLLPIIRSFVASILVVMVVLMILSSMGVDIGPLLAGAGVVGLAVGFGAQKVVSDIFSGIFYLLDDAFRVGEYLTAGAISGTVESISLRNVMLRHHRGMLQIMPHSKMGTITNYMRGGIIEKFSLDFAYDADIDKVRKIIKKVGLEMLDDPELGPGFLRPIKSQGVSSITNSVMTIRVKFTAKPGTQFVIRREAFKRITAALQAKGIQYAHKKVIVDLPEHIVNQMDPAQVQKIAQSAGAAAREIMDEEEKLKQQLAQQKPRE
jgi:small-conductance mechanosensitive channel